jgi:pilus assembly protein CpaF
MVARVGRRLDEGSPMVDARLPDGSRINAVLPPIAIDGAVLTIRKFAADPYTIDDLVSFGTLTRPVADLLAACCARPARHAHHRGTGTGKTTTLNVLSQFLPAEERIVTIEDAAELQLHQEHVLRLESRPPNIEGRGQVTVRDLVRNSLRMRPDRIVIGEVRDGAALDMLQAMNTGHDGLDDHRARELAARLAGPHRDHGADGRHGAAGAGDPRADAAAHRPHHPPDPAQGRQPAVTHITEVTGMEGDVITLQDIFVFDFRAGVDEFGRYRARCSRPAPADVPRPAGRDRV